MVSAMPWHRPMMCARRSASTRVRAKPKNRANTTSGSIAPWAAAMIALDGITPLTHSARLGAPLEVAVAAVPARVAASCSLRGTSDSRAGATMAA